METEPGLDDARAAENDEAPALIPKAPDPEERAALEAAAHAEAVETAAATVEADADAASAAAAEAEGALHEESADA